MHRGKDTVGVVTVGNSSPGPSLLSVGASALQDEETWDKKGTAVVIGQRQST